MKSLIAFSTLLFLIVATARLVRPTPETRAAVPGLELPPEPDRAPIDQESLGGLVAPVRITELDRATSRRLRAFSEPHGHHACATGCAVSHHPSPRLSVEECETLLRDYQASAVDRSGPALDSLLYFGAQTCRHLIYEPSRRLLDQEHLRFLTRELSREQAIVSIRVVDEHQQVHAELPATEVPQHIRQVFTLDAKDLPSLVCSGTVKRVGLHHVWQRL